MKSLLTMFVWCISLVMTGALHCSEKEKKALAATQAKLKKATANWHLKIDTLQKEKHKLNSELERISNDFQDLNRNLRKKTDDEIAMLLYEYNEARKYWLELIEEQLEATQLYRNIMVRIVQGIEGKNLPQDYIDYLKKRINDWLEPIQNFEARIAKTEEQIQTEEELQEEIQHYIQRRDDLLAQPEEVFEKERGIYEED